MRWARTVWPEARRNWVRGWGGWLWVVVWGVLVAGPVVGQVDLTLYNTYPLLHSDGVTPLPGTATSGALVELILAGANGVADSPLSNGAPGGDDTLYFVTHVGKGLPLTNAGLLVQTSIIYPVTYVGLPAYVRFWDAPTIANAQFYGVSALFGLPAGDIFGMAEWDFVPMADSPRVTDTPFQPILAVPEPGALFGLGLALVVWKLRRRWWSAVSLGTLMVVAGFGLVEGQDLRRLDVTASVGIRDEDGMLLAGANPDVGTNAAGCVVQILSVGANGVAELPALGGGPGGDDVVVATTAIGKGMAPNVAVSGRFAVSLYPAPAVGARLYARVFNAASVGTATRWGQSASWEVTATGVMDVSLLGLVGTRWVVGADPRLLDRDGDGQSDFAELVANTNPGDARDRLETELFDGQQLRLVARAGRQYTLQRATQLDASVVWEDIKSVGPLGWSGDLTLQDPAPPAGPQAFYRVRVTMP